MTSRYQALALQVGCHSVASCSTIDDAKARIQSSMEGIQSRIHASKAFLGEGLRLVVLPEYSLTGFPTKETPEIWIDKACIRPFGPEYDRLGGIAKTEDVYLCVNAYEVEDSWKELGVYFQVSSVFDPSGRCILRYRRLNSMYTPTPFDVFCEWEEEELFPVVETEIGRLCCVASEEILFPEVARCAAMRGAEIILHSTSEIFNGTQRLPKDVCKIARAVENNCYVVSANTAGIRGSAIPEASTDGGSKVIDFRGLVLAEAGQGESMVANAEIDLDSLRSFRSRPGMSNLLSRQRPGLYASTYSVKAEIFQTPGTLQENPNVSRSFRKHAQAQQSEVIQKLRDSNVI